MQKTKLVLTFSLFFFSLASAAAAPLIRAERRPGLEPNPVSKYFSLETDGKMWLTVDDDRNHSRQTHPLGQLSPYATEKIASRVNAIDPDLPLIDENQGSPMCTDLPQYSTKVFIRGREKKIHLRAACHEWNLQSYDAQLLAHFPDTFLEM